ncbi:anti-phage protein KwaA [Halomonas sp. AOP43-D1-4]|uniref:anti-phage protein KwaA n=1 Tax=Halomonas sp. AOP43-D1-4 TaxID=3457658 RepID=UPI0040339C9A
MSDTRRKIDLYLLSLALLFVFFLVISTELPSSSFSWSNFESWKGLASNNILPIISVAALLYCIFSYFRFDYDLKGTTNIPFEIDNIEDINYEHLTFLATYVVPLISFDFGSGRQMIVLALLLVVMGIIYIKTDLFYANPSLALLGFHIYKANGSFKNGKRNGIVVICRGRLSEKQKVSYIRLDDRIYYVRRGAE